MRKTSALRYWATLVACCGLTASSIGICTNSLGVFYTPVSEALGVGRGAFAFHATLSALAIGFLSPLAARLIKKSTLRPLLVLGIALSCGSTALMAFAKSVWLFYVLGVLRGVGLTFFSLMPVTTIIGNWFFKRHGLAVGVALSFSGLSGAVFSPLFGHMITALGWQKAYIFMAVFAAILAVPGIFILRLTPEEFSMPPYGGVRERQESISLSQDEPKVSLHRPLLIILACVTVTHTAITGIAQHFPGLSETLGMGAQVGAAMVSAGMVGNIVTKLLIGALSDRIGPFRASACMIIINGVTLGVLLSPIGNIPAVALISAFLYGAVYSVGAVGIPLLTRHIFGPQQYASAYSVMTLFTNIGSALSLTAVGLVYDMTGGYGAALWGGVVINCVNLVLLMLLQRMKSKRGAFD